MGQLSFSSRVSDWIIKLAKKMEKEDDREVDQSRVLLDDRILETPGIALQSAVSEVVRMGTIVKGTLEKSRNVMFTKDYQEILDIKEEENCGGQAVQRHY